MKNKLMITLLLVAFILGSCTQEEHATELQETNLQAQMYDKDYIREAKLGEQLNYRVFHLSQLINKVKSEKIDYDKKFIKKTRKDTGFNKLFFSDLLYSNVLDNKGIEVDSDTEFSLDAFNGLDETDLLPYIEKIKDGEDSQAVFLISSFDENSGEENVLALQFDTEGKVQVINSDIKEEDVFQSGTSKGLPGSVYLVDSDGCSGGIKKGDCGDPVSGGGGSSVPRSMKMRSFVIKDKKDSWVNNNNVRISHASATIVTPGNTYSHCGLGTPNNPINTYCNTRGVWLAQYNNKEIRNGREIRPNYFLGQKKDPTYNKNGSIILYTMFEYDAWPAPSHEFERVINNQTFVVRSRSYQTPYVQEFITTNPNYKNQYGVTYRTQTIIDNSALKYRAN